MLDIVQLATVPSNRARLIAHPHLVPLAIDLFSRRDSGEVAADLLTKLAIPRSLRRSLYLRQGLVEALVARCETTTGFSVYATDILVLLLGSDMDNKFDFVRNGHAGRIARVIARANNNTIEGGDNSIRHREVHRIYKMLSVCITRKDLDLRNRGFADDAENNDEVCDDATFKVLLQEFCHVPGMLDALAGHRSTLSDGVPHSILFVLYRLTECKRIAGELLAFPGVVGMSLRAMRESQTRSSISAMAGHLLLKLACSDLMQALGSTELVAGLLAMVDNEDDDNNNNNAIPHRELARRCLSRLQLAVHYRDNRNFDLHVMAKGSSRFDAQTEAEKNDVLAQLPSVMGGALRPACEAPLPVAPFADRDV